MRFFQKTRGLAACGREQPCGVEQIIMAGYASLVKGACLVLDAVFFKNKGIGCVCSRAVLWNRAALGNQQKKGFKLHIDVFPLGDGTWGMELGGWIT